MAQLVKCRPHKPEGLKAVKSQAVCTCNSSTQEKTPVGPWGLMAASLAEVGAPGQ